MWDCTPPNDVSYIFFKYPLAQNQNDFAMKLQFSKNSFFEALYYVRLYQVPLDSSSFTSFDTSGTTL